MAGKLRSGLRTATEIKSALRALRLNHDLVLYPAPVQQGLAQATVARSKEQIFVYPDTCAGRLPGGWRQVEYRGGAWWALNPELFGVLITRQSQLGQGV